MTEGPVLPLVHGTTSASVISRSKEESNSLCEHCVAWTYQFLMECISYIEFTPQPTK